jgi:arabinose-5-phosphate isomerase
VTSFVVATTIVDAVALQLGGQVRHPGGYIGAMSRPVKDYMLPPPIVAESTPIREVIPALGHGAVLIDTGGIFTDGDLRRAAGAGRLEGPVGASCTRTPVTVEEDEPARVALERMERRASQISVLPVVGRGRYVGIVRLHDLVRAGLGA